MKIRAPWVYVFLLAGVSLAVAWLRWDLLSDALQRTLWNLHRGWSVRLYALGQIALLSCIIALTFWSVPSHVDVAQDVPAAAAALLSGALVEAWGTQNGLWEYYTHERPPWWIIPVWPIGTMVIDRVSRRLEAWGRNIPQRFYRAGYSLFAASFVLASLGFAGPRLGHLGLILMTGMALALGFHPNYRKDACILASGSVLVFFADLWGQDNFCWVYRPSPCPGALFGMLFDSALVLSCLKLGRAAKHSLRRRVLTI